MKKIVSLVFLIVIFACNDQNGAFKNPENALDAGREFIDHSLKGHFSKAKKYMLQSEENNYWLDKVSKDYNKYSEQDKTGYSTASINIMEVAEEVPDSITIINYSNSYIKRPQKLKVIRHNGEWRVDFNYTFSGSEK